MSCWMTCIDLRALPPELIDLGLEAIVPTVVTALQLPIPLGSVAAILAVMHQLALPRLVLSGS
jgi:hypothetical protein